MARQRRNAGAAVAAVPRYPEDELNVLFVRIRKAAEDAEGEPAQPGDGISAWSFRIAATRQAGADQLFGSYPSRVYRESKCFADSLLESAMVLRSYSQKSGSRVILRFQNPSETKISPKSWR